VKKPTTIKKLTLQKETLTNLREVTGGSQLNDTVYHPPAKSANCITAAGGSYA
jgi:hypothetical protein